LAKSHGYRRRTRSLLRSSEKRGLTSLLREYALNDRVVIKIDPSQVKGMPHRRFNGLVGVVKGVDRRVINFDVPVGNKTKTLITRKEHVIPLEVK
jgi:large subunit ribosomal protein L21e